MVATHSDMGHPALRWIRTLANPASWRAQRKSAAPEAAYTPTSSTGIHRISLIPETPEEEPRFSEHEVFAHWNARSVRESSPGTERRTSERTPFIADLRFGEDVELYTGLSLDISEGGLFVATYTEIPVGTRLVLCFELPDGSMVEARGEVRWTRPEGMDGERPGIGVAFTELPNAAREQILALCERRSPLYFEL